MTRSITFYIISANMEHDKTNFCFDFECEPDTYSCWEYSAKYYELLNPAAKDIEREDYPKVMDYNIAINRRINEQHKLWNSWKHKDLWCSKCKMYKYGICCCDYIIDSIDVHYSNSNPIWDSEWNIHNFYLGSFDTNFIRRFGKEYMMREITEPDVIYAYKKNENMGEPIRTCDIEAKEETTRVLDFLQPYVKRDDVYVIIFDE